MSGMLPGVEVARRRRLGHQRGGWSDSPATVAYGSFRRASLCSKSRSHDNSSSSASSSSSSSSSVYEDDGKLGEAAREAKERLDERLRAQTRKVSATRRQDPINSRSSSDGRPEREQVGISLKKGGSKRFLNWTGLINWKDMEQDECAVCLERFVAGETLMHLPCAHRFHSGCLIPWLESNAHCPCCRTMVPS